MPGKLQSQFRSRSWDSGVRSGSKNIENQIQVWWVLSKEANLMMVLHWPRYKCGSFMGICDLASKGAALLSFPKYSVSSIPAYYLWRLVSVDCLATPEADNLLNQTPQCMTLLSCYKTGVMMTLAHFISP